MVIYAIYHAEVVGSVEFEPAVKGTVVGEQLMPRIRWAVRAKVPFWKPTTPKRPKKLKQWTDILMVSAMKAVKSGSMGVNRAAAEFGVPRTTLKDRFAKRVVHGTNPGPIPYLSVDEEKQLVEFLVSSSKMGFGKTRGEVY